MTRSSNPSTGTAERQERADSLDRAIARAEMTVVRLRGTLRLLAALGLSQDNVSKRLQAAERHIEALRDTRDILLAARTRWRKAS